MRTQRAVSINVSLAQGICNYNCVSCSVNKPSYSGRKLFQSKDVTEALVQRINGALRKGVKIRNVAVAGSGEPTLHPEFSEHMDILGKIRSQPHVKEECLPTLYLVTNGTNLHKSEVLDVLERNRVNVRISFPTPDNEHYAKIMMPGNEKTGRKQFDRVCSSIDEVMKRVHAGKIPGVAFHISPPVMEHVRPDFHKTMDFLTKKCSEHGLKELHAEIIPGRSNRGGHVGSRSNNFDFMKDLIRRYNGNRVNNVKVILKTTGQYFYPHVTDILDILKTFEYPCLYYGNIYLNARGESTCCNDQNSKAPVGNIMTNSIEEIMTIKEAGPPMAVCRSCNLRPDKLHGTVGISIYKAVATLKAGKFLRRMKSAA